MTTRAHPRKVFSFWEPAGSMPAYLSLCMETWTPAFLGHELVHLDYSRLDEYVQLGAFDFTAFRKLSLMMQREVISVAVLHGHGGVFLDVDTLVLGDIKPILERLERSEFILFNRHLAFLASNPGSQVLAAWLAGIQDRLARLRGDDALNPQLPWGYMGNEILEEVLDRLAGIRPENDKGKASAFRKIVTRIRRRLMIGIVHRRKIEVLARDKYGFIAEAVHRPRGVPARDPGKEYLDFWFSPDIPLATVLAKRPPLIGLHNSWTPDWYKALTRREVLDHPCLLSRLLRHLVTA